MSVLVAVCLGWWLAVRTLALRIGAVVGAVAPALSDGSASVGGGGAAPPTPNGEVLAEPIVSAAARISGMVPLKDRAEDYLTVKELEGYLPLCGKSIRREIADGKLPSHKMRGKLTVKGSDALAWLLARKEGGFNAKNAEGAVS